ncbi:MAG: phage tail protein [Burkholderiaceae bacterium]
MQQVANDNGSQLLTVSESAGTVTVSGGSGDGSALLMGQQANSVACLRITRYTNSPNLAPYLQGLFGNTLIQPTDTFAGVALLLIQASYSQDIFPSGLPRISAVVRGARVTDPRNNVTAWSENPALIAWDWARYPYGGARPTPQLVQSDFVAAANVCDVVTNFSLAGGGTETRPLYQCGMVVPLDLSPQDTLDQMVRAMAGRWAWAGGKLRVVAGSYRAPVFTIDESMVSDAQPIEFLAQVATSELFNVGRTYFADAAQGYLEANIPEVRSAAYIAADGGEELVRETRLPSVTRGVHAQHITHVDMRDLRDGLTFKCPLKFAAYQLEVFDTVAVNLPAYGWSNKVFEVMSWGFSLQSAVVCELKEHSAVTYQPNAGLGVIDAAPNTSLPDPRNISPVLALSVSPITETQADGQIITKALALWNPSTDVRVLSSGYTVIEWQQASPEPEQVAWQNVSMQGVALFNVSARRINSFTPGVLPTLSESKWRRSRERGDVNQRTITTLQAGAVYVFRAYNESALGVRSALSEHVYLRVNPAPLVATVGLEQNATYEVFSADGAPIPVTLTIDPGAPVFQGRITELAAIQVIAAVKGELRISAVVQCESSNAWNGQDGGSTVIETGPLSQVASVDCPPTRASQSMEAAFSIEAGETINVRLLAKLTRSVGIGLVTGSWYYARLVVEYLKR